MGPEEELRVEIDEMLEAAGWEVQDYGDHNLGANNGHVILREFQIGMDAADYVLFLNRQAVGVIKVKPKIPHCRVSRNNRGVISIQECFSRAKRLMRFTSAEIAGRNSMQIGMNALLVSQKRLRITKFEQLL